MSVAALLLAAALLLGGGPIRCRTVTGTPPVRAVVRAGPEDPLAIASSLDVFAACLSSGMAVGRAARATAPSAPRPLAAVLDRAADLLELGAEPETAWSNPDAVGDDHVAALCRLARRSAGSGSALAQAVCDLADQSRRDAADAARATAERASVLIAGPLGVCYLPAFVCLGIVPVVVGLAGDVLHSGVW